MYSRNYLHTLWLVAIYTIAGTTAQSATTQTSTRATKTKAHSKSTLLTSTSGTTTSSAASAEPTCVSEDICEEEADTCNNVCPNDGGSTTGGINFDGFYADDACSTTAVEPNSVAKYGQPFPMPGVMQAFKLDATAKLGTVTFYTTSNCSFPDSAGYVTVEVSGAGNGCLSMADVVKNNPYVTGDVSGGFQCVEGSGENVPGS